MKTKSLFLIIGLIILGGIGKVNAQFADSFFAGIGAGFSNGAATDNTGIGTNALYFNTTVGNTALGSQALQYTGIYPALNADCRNTPSTPENEGSHNTAVGSRALNLNTIGRYNCAFGSLALTTNSTGYGNTALGRKSLIANDTGCYNVAVGYYSLLTGSNNSHNIAVGYYTPRSFTGAGGSYNTFIGDETAVNLFSGSANTMIGKIAVNSSPSSPTTVGNDTSRTIILADGLSNQRLLFQYNGFGGVGLGNNVKPQNTFEIKALAVSPPVDPGFTQSGFRLTSLPNNNFNHTPPNSANRVLSVNANGDVILVDDVVGGGGTSNIENLCTDLNFATRTGDGNGNLTCTQIYDNWNGNCRPTFINSSGVSIGWCAPVPANVFTPSGTITGGPLGVTPTKLKLRVNGASQSNFTLITSDQNYKTNINGIDKIEALEKVLRIKGYSYNWDKVNNPAINFDDNDHTGFIAQQIETVLPHLVYNTEDIIAVNDKDVRYDKRKSVNYIEIIPYLVESIKALNDKITNLENQIVCLNERTGCNQITYKASNTPVFENTKIVVVSPNPSKDIVNVSVNIEKEVENATLQVFDVNGKQLQTINIRERGNDINKTLLKDNYGSGVYVISLFANGKSVDTKKIVFE